MYEIKNMEEILKSTLWSVINAMNRQQHKTCSLLAVSSSINNTLTFDLAIELMTKFAMPFMLLIHLDNDEMSDTYFGTIYGLGNNDIAYT